MGILFSRSVKNHIKTMLSGPPDNPTTILSPSDIMPYLCKALPVSRFIALYKYVDMPFGPACGIGLFGLFFCLFYFNYFSGGNFPQSNDNIFISRRVYKIIRPLSNLSYPFGNHVDK